MTPQEKIDSLTKSLELLKILCGKNLELLPNPSRVMLAETIVAAQRDKMQSYSYADHIDGDDLQELASNLTELELFALFEKTGVKTNFTPQRQFYESYSLLSPVEIVTQWYGLDLCGINIGLLNDRVVGRWRKRYDYSTKIRPCRNNISSTYLYYSFDWDLVGEVLTQMGIEVTR